MAQQIDELEFVSNLDPTDAYRVLLELCEDDTLKKKIVSRAKELLSDIDVQKIEDNVFFCLNNLMVEDYYEYKYNSEYSDLDESESPFDAIEREVYGYIFEMERYRKLGMKEIEKQYCIGVVGGLLRYGIEGSNELRNHISEEPFFIADDIIEEWKKHNPPEAWSDVEAVRNRIIDDYSTGNDDNNNNNDSDSDDDIDIYGDMRGF